MKVQQNYHVILVIVIAGVGIHICVYNIISLKLHIFCTLFKAISVNSVIIVGEVLMNLKQNIFAQRSVAHFITEFISSLARLPASAKTLIQ